MSQHIGKFTKAVQLATQKNIELKSKESLKWFRQYTSKHLRDINTLDALKEVSETKIKSPQHGIRPGEIITFDYDPKTKDKLPYYDTTPLILPLSYDKKGFTGLNLHYLTPVDRARLMDLLFRSESSVRGYMHALAVSPYYKPCYKRYLYSHVRSRVHIFEQQHWEIAIYLPLARFQKGSQGLAASKSKQIMRKHREQNAV